MITANSKNAGFSEDKSVTQRDTPARLNDSEMAGGEEHKETQRKIPLWDSSEDGGT